MTADCTGRRVMFEPILFDACWDSTPSADAWSACNARVLQHTRHWRLAPGPLEAWVRRTFPDPQTQPWAYPLGR